MSPKATRKISMINTSPWSLLRTPNSSKTLPWSSVWHFVLFFRHTYTIISRMAVSFPEILLLRIVFQIYSVFVLSKTFRKLIRRDEVDLTQLYNRSEVVNVVGRERSRTETSLLSVYQVDKAVFNTSRKIKLISSQQQFLLLSSRQALFFEILTNIPSFGKNPET